MGRLHSEVFAYERAAVTWDVCSAVIMKSDSEAPKNVMMAGWLPSKYIAELWLQAAQYFEP
jgi:hypothetical protein